jgi:hypothetical protein
MTITIPTHTQGQHDVLFDLVQPYEHFPKQITGSTVWRAEDFRAEPERWQKRWSEEHVRELEEAYEAFERTGLPLTAITRVRHTRYRER